MMMAFYLFCACLVMQVFFSFVYPCERVVPIRRLYWNSLSEPLSWKGWKGIGNYKFLSLVLLVAVILLFYLFR
jgi:SSS family solute:Na+ symporter